MRFCLGLELVACLMDIDRGWGCRVRMAGFSGSGLNMVTSLDLSNVSVHVTSGMMVFVSASSSSSSWFGLAFA